MPRDVLPLGSVVRLRDGGEALVMVMGFEPVLGEARAEYLGIPYPMGLMSEDGALAFDASAIEEVLYWGYLDDRGQEAFDAVRRYRVLARESMRAVDELIEDLTPERVEELMVQYAPLQNAATQATGEQWQEGIALLTKMMGAAKAAEGGQGYPAV